MEDIATILNRKTKNKGWFKTGNIFFDEYIKVIGYTPAIVYLCIKRHEYGKTRIAFPSQEVIAQKLNISERTVLRAIKILETYKFISIRKERRQGQWRHNVYFLNQSSEWLKELIKSDDYTTNNTSPDDKRGENYATQSHIKKTIKNTIKKESLLKETEEKLFSLKDYKSELMK